MGISQTLGLLFEINADPSHAISALQLLEEEIGQKLASSFGVSTEKLKQWGEASLAAFEDVTKLGEGLSEIGGLLFEAAEHAAHYAEEVGHVAEKTGATAEQISTLNYAAHMANASIEGGSGALDRMSKALTGVPESSEVVSRALGFLAKNLGDVQKGAGQEVVLALNDLGISENDVRIHTGNLSALLPTLIERLARVEDRTRRASDASALFGRGGRDLIPVLDQFAGGFKAVEEHARKMGVLIGEDDVRAADQFLAEQRALTAEMQGFALTLGKDVMPYAMRLLAWLHDAKTELEVVRLRALGVSEAMMALATSGISLIWAHKNLKEATQLETKALQKETNWLVELQKQMHAAAVAAIPQIENTQAAAQASDAENHANAQKITVYDGVAMAQKAWNLELARRAELQRQAAAADKAEFEMQAMLFPIQRQEIQNLQILSPLVGEQTERTVHLSEARRMEIQISQDLQESYKKEVEAVGRDLPAATQNLASGLAGLIGGQRAAAAVKAVWETARGVELLAEGTWPPNPAALVASGLHFEAAAEFGKIAGTSSHRGGGAGGSGARGVGSRASGGYRDSGSGGQPPPQTLAQGAQSDVGRGVVIIRGEEAFENHVAAAVNAAVARGVNVTATSSQRGAPVGH